MYESLHLVHITIAVPALPLLGESGAVNGCMLLMPGVNDYSGAIRYHGTGGQKGAWF